MSDSDFPEPPPEGTIVREKREWSRDSWRNIPTEAPPSPKRTLFGHIEHRRAQRKQEEHLLAYEQLARATPYNDVDGKIRKRLAEAEALRKKHEDAKRAKAFKTLKDQKAQKAADERKREAAAKHARGVLDLGSMFEKKPLVHDWISGKSRPLQEEERARLAAASAAAAARDEDGIEIISSRTVSPVVRPYEPPKASVFARATASVSLFELEPGDEWINSADEAEAVGGVFARQAYEDLLEQRPLGCANQVECRAKVCRHHVDTEHVPLEAVLRRGEQKSDKITVCAVPVNPFFAQFALADAVEKIENTLFREDETLSFAVRNDDITLARTMTAQCVTIADYIVRLRRDYHAEKASILRRHQNDIKRSQDRFDTFYNAAVARNDLRLQADLARSQAQHVEAARSLCVKASIALVNRFRAIVSTAVLQASVTQRFALRFEFTVEMLLDIVLLADGAHRSDAFYREMATEVSLGHCETVLAEKLREESERTAAKHIDKAVGMSKEVNADLLREFSKISRLTGPRTVVEKRKADEISTEDENAGGPMEIKAIDPSRYVPQQNAPATVDLGWQASALWRKPVCDAQTAFKDGATACTPIAVLCALRLATISESKLSSIRFAEEIVNPGAHIWRDWYDTSPQSTSYMLVPEVVTTSRDVRDTIERYQLSTKEIGGTLVDGSDEALNCSFAAAVSLLESEAARERFAAVLTCGIFAITVAHVGNDYYLFDSHGDTIDAAGGSVFLCFSTMMDLDAAVIRRFANASAVYSMFAFLCRPPP
jgi:hypothetical protein